jgi:hypothetical protein
MPAYDLSAIDIYDGKEIDKEGAKDMTPVFLITR